MEPSPLDIILAVMHRRWSMDDEKGAVEMAKLAAPFVHPRATAGSRDAHSLAPENMSDDELGCGGDPSDESHNHDA